MNELNISAQIAPEMNIEKDNPADINLGNVETRKHNKLSNLDFESSGHTGFQKELTFDDAPTENSLNPVKSGGVYTALDNKVDKAVGMGLTRIFEMGDHYVVYSQGGDVEVYSNEQTDNLALPKNTVSGSEIKLTDHLENKPIISCKIYGTEAGVGDLVSSGEYAGKYKIAIAVRGKNLFNVNDFSNISNVTINGNKITITNKDYVNASDAGILKRLKSGKTYSGLTKHTLISGTSSSSTGRVALVSTSGASNIYFGSGGNFTNKTMPDNLSDYSRLYLFATRNGVVTFEDIQIEEGTIYTDYEPYRYPVIREIYLDAPLGENESVSIDGLSTIASSVNTINVETENAPSKIEVRYYRDINKVLANLENAILSQGGNV